MPPRRFVNQVCSSSLQIDEETVLPSIRQLTIVIGELFPRNVVAIEQNMRLAA